ncbi:hypothetical protein F5146DRAFT_1139039 [Armillaria mellea]|nr:hypothetical protein F5146DRAFT_1139039 [Armillaria mellea]
MPLFRLPLSTDFLELDMSSLIRGPGFWTADCQSIFEDRCRLILGKCATIPTGDDKSVAGANHVEELQVDAALFLDWLKSMLMTFHRLCLSVVETQRLVLEVQAIWAYFLTIWPRFTALDSTSSMCKVDMDLVGCFTTNIWVAQQLHGAGVPVWVLRPLDDLVHMRIDKVVVITTMDGRVHLGPCPLCLRLVFVGSGAQEGKYKAFNQFTRSQFEVPNVFAWTSGQLRSEPTTSWVRKNVLAEGVFAPCWPLLKGYEVITHELLLAIRRPWQEALLCVNAEKAGLHVPAAPFAFPHLDLFVTISDSAKRRSVLSTWLHLRPGHVTMQTSSYSPAKLSHQMWRTILSYDWVGKSEEHDQVRGRETKCCDLAASFLVGCLDEMSIQDGASVEPTWQGKSMTELATDDVHEILWELSELGFRLEFLSLDTRLRLIEGDSALKKHKIHVGHCFPWGQYDRCWIA